MRLTKYEHACVIVEEQGQKLVIDPGMFAEIPEGMSGAAAIVITHDHGDHFTDENIARLKSAAPDTPIYTTAEVAAKIQGAETVDTDKEYPTGPFNLKFYGGQHQQVHPDYPSIENYGVLVNGKLYYPGDSFAQPDKPVEVLLVPAAAPWMKTAEAMDFVGSVKPKLAIPTHDAVLSEQGASFTDNWLKQAAEKAGGEYRRLQPGESIDI